MYGNIARQIDAKLSSQLAFGVTGSVATSHVGYVYGLKNSVEETVSVEDCDNHSDDRDVDSPDDSGPFSLIVNSHDISYMKIRYKY